MSRLERLGLAVLSLVAVLSVAMLWWIEVAAAHPIGTACLSLALLLVTGATVQLVREVGFRPLERRQGKRSGAAGYVSRAWTVKRASGDAERAQAGDQR